MAMMLQAWIVFRPSCAGARDDLGSVGAGVEPDLRPTFFAASSSMTRTPTSGWT